MFTSLIFSISPTPFYIILSDGVNFSRVYFTSKLLRDTAELLADNAELLGGDILGITPNGITKDQWFGEIESRYANMYDFYGLPELPE